MNKNKEIENFLQSIPEEFQILEKGIDMGIQREYIELENKIGFENNTDEEILVESEKIFEETTTNELKKHILLKLANIGSVESYRKIEKFYKTDNIELKAWAILALQECRILLENSLTDEGSCFISTGLGGKDNKLRFYFLVMPIDEKPFTDTQKKIIQNEYSILSKELESEVEQIDSADNYNGLTVLLPMDVAIGIYIEKGIERCNEYGNFVFKYYFITNEKIPTKEEILEYIELVKNDSEDE